MSLMLRGLLPADDARSADGMRHPRAPCRRAVLHPERQNACGSCPSATRSRAGRAAATATTAALCSPCWRAAATRSGSSATNTEQSLNYHGVGPGADVPPVPAQHEGYGGFRIDQIAADTPGRDDGGVSYPGLSRASPPTSRTWSC